MSQKYKNALPAAGGAAGSADGPWLDPVAVQNYAYLKLLKWDHLHRPFPEVGAPGQADCSFLSCTAELLKNSYNSHRESCSFVNCIIPGFLVHSQSCASITTVSFQNIVITRKETLDPLAVTILPPFSPHPLATYSLSRWIWPILDFLFKRNHTILAVHV